MKSTFTALSPETADLILLILASQGIPAQSLRQEGGIDILTRPEHASAARHHKEAYFRENRVRSGRPDSARFPAASFFSPPVFVIMGILVLVHALKAFAGTHTAWVMTFGASSLFIGQGETFRAVTALFLHADVRHLLGNLGGLILFGAPLASLAGYGMGPLILLAAGTGGNLINAWLHGNALLSVGASTAVMGAAGALSALRITRPGRFLRWPRVFPLFAAATLVMMFSQGERTDVTAHVFGFFYGLAAGTLAFPLIRVLPPSLQSRLQPLSLGFTLLVLAAALAAGIQSPHFDLHHIVGSANN